MKILNTKQWADHQTHSLHNLLLISIKLPCLFGLHHLHRTSSFILSSLYQWSWLTSFSSLWLSSSSVSGGGTGQSPAVVPRTSRQAHPGGRWLGTWCRWSSSAVPSSTWYVIYVPSMDLSSRYRWVSGLWLLWRALSWFMKLWCRGGRYSLADQRIRQHGLCSVWGNAPLTRLSMGRFGGLCGGTLWRSW